MIRGRRSGLIIPWAFEQPSFAGPTQTLMLQKWRILRRRQNKHGITGFFKSRTTQIRLLPGAQKVDHSIDQWTGGPEDPEKRRLGSIRTHIQEQGLEAPVAVSLVHH